MWNNALDNVIFVCIPAYFTAERGDCYQALVAVT
jgi:hypothetical protein